MTVTSDTRRLAGPSGAQLIIGETTTWKYDTSATHGRVREQGIWLCDTEDKIKQIHLPHVLTVAHDGYEMETLRVTPLNDVCLNTLILQIHEALHNIWETERSSTAIFISWDGETLSLRQHLKYVTGLARLTGCRSLITPLVRYAHAIDWWKLARGLTHGDPIVDNTAWRHHDKPAYRTLVLIDPIPATTFLPSVRALDVGRLIQSAVGYEKLRYDVTMNDYLTGAGGLLDIRKQVEWLLNEVYEPFDLNEARAALYWSVIHMMRGVRTAHSARVADALRNRTFTLHDQVVKPWMQ